MQLDVLFQLPFHLIMKIFSFNPRLPSFHRSIVISHHLKKKYCHQCGEYIEGFIHAHERRARYKSKEYKYLSMYLHVEMNLNLNKKSMYHGAITQQEFDDFFKYKDYFKIPIRVILLKSRIQYYYNFKKFCNHRSKRIIPMIDTQQFNIFENPNIYSVNDFQQQYPQFSNYDILNSSTLYTSSRSFFEKDDKNHEKNILDIIQQCVKYDFEFMSFFYTSFIKYESVLNYFSTLNLKKTIHIMSQQSSTPDELFLKVIEGDIDSVKYIAEKKLNRLFKKNRWFFIDLYDNMEDASEYFTLFNVMEETLEIRNQLAMIS